MTIFDGVGGVIALALSPGELGRFVEAYRWLAANTLDGGVGTIKVALGAKTYLLHRRPMAGNNQYGTADYEHVRSRRTGGAVI